MAMPLQKGCKMKIRSIGIATLFTVLSFQASAYVRPCENDYKFYLLCRAPIPGAEPSSDQDSLVTVSYKELITSQNPHSDRTCTQEMGVLANVISADVGFDVAGSTGGLVEAHRFEKIPDGRIYQLTNLGIGQSANQPHEIAFLRSANGFEARVNIVGNFSTHPGLHSVRLTLPCVVYGGVAPVDFP
jgi:hypothetical protein